MAYNSSDNLSEEHAKFEAGQRKLLEQIADTAPENVLDAAEGIRVITPETKDRIIDVFNKSGQSHELLFQRAYAMEAKKHPHVVAFVRAFEGIYGKFLFEQQRDDVKNQESTFIRMLSKILSNRIEAPDGTIDAAEKKSLIALRSELEAVARRLSDLDASVTGETDEKKMTLADILTEKMRKAGVTGKKPSAWVLEQAFPGVKIEVGKDKKMVVKIRGFETNFKHVAKVLKDAQDYFNSPEEMQKLNDKLQEVAPLIESIKTVLTVAETARLKEMGVEFSKDQSLSSKIKALETVLGLLKGQRSKQGDQQETVKLGVKLAATMEKLREIKAGSDEIYVEVKKLADHLKIVQKAGIKLDGLTDADISALISGVPPKASDFDIQKLEKVQVGLSSFFDSGTNVSNLADAIRKAQEEIAKSTNLSDAKAAKKILGVMINEQMPDMPVTEQGKLAQLTLSKDVAVIQSKRDHRELAEKAGAEFLDLAQVFGFRTLVELKFKIGEKESHPFKDMKPADFMDEAKIRDHFSTGKFNLDNGFLVLAALEIFAGGGGEAAQYAVVEEELRNLIAAELGVKERQDEAGAESIISSAFEDYIKKSRPLVAKFFSHYDRNRQEWDGNKIKELNARYKELNESLRRGEISNEIYTKRRAELLEETQNVKMLDQVDYSESTIMDEFWHSKEAQWLRDLGVNTGKFAGKKALRGVGKVTGFVAGGVTKAVGSRVAGVAGVGAMGTWKSALGLVKYPALIAAKPLVGFINLFRKEKWTPLPRIRDSLRGDVAEVFGTYGKVKESMYGTLDSGLKRDWKPIAYESTKYADRSKVKPEELRKQIEEFKAKGSATAIEIGEVKVDMQKYKDQIKSMDEAEKESEKKAA